MTTAPDAEGVGADSAQTDEGAAGAATVATAPEAAQPAAESDSSIPPSLSWVAASSSGAVMELGDVVFSVQGPSNAADASDDVLWADAPVSTVHDNTGQSDYVGSDLDARAGYFRVTRLVDDADPGSVHDVAADESYRLRPVEAEGFLSGSDANWVVLESSTSADAPAATLVLLPDDTRIPAARTAPAVAAKTVSVFAVPPGGANTGSYNTTGDDTNPSAWSGSHSQVTPQQSQLLSFSSMVVGTGNSAVLKASWVRPSTTGTFGWSVEYTNAPERWGGSPLVPRPDRSLGGQVIFIDSGTTTAAACVYGGASGYAYPSAWNSPGCTPLNYAQTVTFTNSGGNQMVSISVPLSDGAFGSDGCPPLIGETGYVRSWTGTARNLKNWVAPVEQDNSGVSTCPGLTLTKQLDQQFDLGVGKKVPADWVLTATPQPAIPGQSAISGNGTIASTSLKPGTYLLSESANPMGYVLKTNWACVSASGDQGTPWTFDPATSKLTIHEKNRVSCTIVNADLPGTAKWNKVDDQTPAHKIGGSVWSLLGPAGANSSTVSVTDNTGQAGYTGLDLNPAAGEFELGNLKWGDYTLTETSAPTGYSLTPLAPTISFTVSAGVGVLSYVRSTPVVNPRVLGEAAWSKTDDQLPTHPLAGSVWTVSAPGLPLDGEEVTDCVAGSVAECLGPDKNPAAGAFLLQSLQWGDYTLTETEAPEGYELSDQPPSFSFTIDSTHLSYAHETPIVNSRILGKASWQKVDADNGEQLAGSEWSLVGPAGPTSDSVTVTDNTGQLGYVGLDTDPVAGEFEIANLGWGSYTLTETKAPAGYYLSDSPPSFTFTIDAAHLVFAPDNPIENQKMQVPGVPITGGMGSDLFTIAGGGALLVALALLGMARRRRSAL